MKNKITLIHVLALLLTIVIFWSGSRYDQLMEKSLMGDRNILQGISFGEFWVYDPGDSFPERIFTLFVNWCHTNYKGMLFGLILAAVLFGLFSFLKFKPSQGSFKNAVQGFVLGLPLGVCVNCATPIGQSMMRSQIRPETFLMTMFTSPSFNILVLSMLFTFLPLPIALAKVFFTFIFLVIVYFISRKFSIPKRQEEREESAEGRAYKKWKQKSFLSEKIFSKSLTWHQENPSWTKAIQLFVRSFFYNLFLICKISLPMMLLAGILGSFLVELFPLSSETFQINSNLFLNLFLLSGLATLLPVPIAFDVIITSILFQKGIAHEICMVFLFGLGIYSIYPHLIIYKDASKRLASLILLSVVSLGVLSGLTVRWVQSMYNQGFYSYYAPSADHNFDPNEFAQLILSECSPNQGSSPSRQKNFQMDCMEAVFDQFDTLNTSLSGFDVEFCQYFPNIDLQRKCVSSVSLSRNIHNQTISFDHQGLAEKCSKFKIADIVRLCLKKTVLQSVLKGMSLDTCYQLKDEGDISECFYYGITLRFGIEKDISLCDKITIPAYRKGCQNKIRYRSIFQKVQTWQDCKAYFFMEVIRNTCLVDFFESQKVRKNRPSCSSLGDPSASRACHYGYRSKGNEWYKSISSCYLFHENQAYPLLCSKDSSDEKEPFGKTSKKRPTRSCSTHENSSKECKIEHALQKIRNYLNSYFWVHSKVMANALRIREPLEKTQGHPLLKSYKKASMNLFFESKDIKISYRKHTQRNTGAPQMFTKREGNEVNIIPEKFMVADFMEPYSYGRGLSAGDINQDGLEDLVFAGRGRIFIFMNQGRNKHFKKYILSLDKTNSLDPRIAALLDWNNDRCLDIYFSSHSGRHFIYLCGEGYTFDQLIELPGLKGAELGFNLSSAFYDTNQDRKLDLLAAHWSGLGVENTAAAVNVLYMSEKNGHKPSRIYEVPGQTLTTLFSDFNNDHHTDLLIGNDFEVPDMYYVKDPLEKKYQLLKKENPYFDLTSYYTMSIETADFNNDLRLDIFSSDMNVEGTDKEEYCDEIKNKQERKYCKINLASFELSTSFDYRDCEKIHDLPHVPVPAPVP